ncbi:MAG: type II secretion system minor pseudopilin GspK [Proteobacteria bacterium]|nr:type II secretion system minor pseudopilin GspK [Pseudomonadota bacterium]
MMVNSACPESRQRGVALVSILLVVAIATVMAVSMITEQQGSIQATRAFLDRGQAQQYALGGEELARQILAEDFLAGDQLDRMSEAWADPELHYDFEDGELNLQITDLQGLFNVNNLADNGSGIARQRLNNLLVALGLDVSVADRVQDWVDSDTGMRPAGAEDYDYLIFEPPYRAANSAMADVSEIALLGLEPDTFRQLRAHLAALPESRVRLNVNTATPVALQSLAQGLSLDAAVSLAERRDEQEGFETVQAFLQAPELAGLGVAADGLGVQSSFFEIRVIARYQDRFSYLTSIVHRNATDGSMRIIKRDFSRQFRPVSTSSTGEGDA